MCSMSLPMPRWTLAYVSGVFGGCAAAMPHNRGHRKPFNLTVAMLSGRALTLSARPHHKLSYVIEQLLWNDFISNDQVNRLIYENQVLDDFTCSLRWYGITGDCTVQLVVGGSLMVGP